MPRRLFSATPSKLASFADCPRRYRYAYVDRPTPQRGPAWAHNTVGAAVHAALRSWWDLPVEKRTTGAARQLLYAAWSQNGFRDAEQAERWRARAAGWLTDYVATLDPTDEPVGNERTVGATTERLALSGRVDRIDLRGDELVIVDYKTGRVGLHRRRGPGLTGARGLRPRRAAHPAAALHPRRAAPPAQRHGGLLRAHRAVAGQPRAAGRGHRHRHHRGHRARWRRGRTPTPRSRPSPGSSAAGATSGRAARPVRPPSRSRETWSFLAEDDAPLGESGGRFLGHAVPAGPDDRRARARWGSRSRACRKRLQRRRSRRRR